MLKLSLPRSSNKFFLQILKYIALAISLTIFFLSFTLHINFENIILTLTHSYVKDSLSQVSYSANFMVDSAKTLLYQIYKDDQISKLFYLYPPDGNDQPFIYSQLATYRESAPLIQSIYVYNADTGTIYSSGEGDNNVSSSSRFFDQDVFNLLKKRKSDNQIIPYPRLIPSKAIPEFGTVGNSSVYSFVFTDTFASEKETGLESAVILNVSEEWLRGIIDSMDVSPGSNTFIINNQGVMVSGNKLDNMLTDISKEDYIKNIIHGRGDSGYFVGKVRGAKSLITFVSSPTLGWKFVRITPYTQIVSKINQLRLITLLISSVILILGVFVSFYLSRKLYTPVDRVFKKLDSLEKEKRDNFYSLKHEFLKSLVLGENEYSTESVQKKFDQLSIKLNSYSGLQLLLIQIDGYSSFCENNTANDRSLFRFGIVNIASEICDLTFINDGVDMDYDYMVVLLNIPSPLTENHDSKLKEMLTKLQETVYQCLRIQISITVSLPYSSFSYLSIAYQEAVEASGYRLYYGHQALILCDQIHNIPPKPFVYPIQKEKQLVDALTLGKIDVVRKLYYEVVEDLTQYSYRIFRYNISRLAYAVSNAWESIISHSGNSILSQEGTFVTSLNHLDTISEIHNIFEDVFDKITICLMERKEPKYDELLKQVDNIVKNRFMDQNLTRDTVADSVGMSPTYLGRLFIKLTSKTISDFINEVRMEKAKVLLTTTNYSVNEIVDQVGFLNSSYFYTNFKKLHGVTPNEYRLNNGSSLKA